MKAFIASALVMMIWAVSPFVSPAIAADMAQGAQVFAANCAACHIGGGNAIMNQKTLKSGALEQYLDGYGAEHDINAIIKQVTYGKNAMAAFGSRLSETEIASVAAYVQDKSDNGW